jgi:Carboxypeptidase regulatory-like domain
MRKKRKKKTGSVAVTPRLLGPGLAPEIAHLVRAAACLALFCLLPLAPSAKQKKPLTKTVQGAVLDAANNPIVGATVELTDETTGTTLGLYTEAGGRYQFTQLKPTDDYKIRATYKGQASDVRHASSLDDRGIVVLNLTIPPPASP